MRRDVRLCAIQRQFIKGITVVAAVTVAAGNTMLSAQAAERESASLMTSTAPSEDTRRFDFGGPRRVERGYLAVNSALIFSAERGHGWVQNPGLLVRDSGKPDPLRRDFVMGKDPATFRIAGLQPRLYQLTVVCGDLLSGNHATRVRVPGNTVELPVMAPAAAEAVTLTATVSAGNSLDITFDSPRGSWIVCALSLTPADAPAAPKLTRERMSPDADDMAAHTLVFSTQSVGEKLQLSHWGLDTAWDSPDNMRRGVMYMGQEQVDIVRVSFPINEPLVNGDLPASKKRHFESRLETAKIAGDKPFSMLPDTDRGVHPWFKNGKDVDPQRWVQLIAAAQRLYGRKMLAVEAFNEADWGWGQGSAQNLSEILAALQKHPDFEGVELSGPSTLSSDAAESWYQAIKHQIVRGTTHALGGSFPAFINFYLNVDATGHVAEHPEVHNLVEVISGAEYGVQSAIWWGTAERARGDFVKAVQGTRLAYAEDRPRWSAAGVYRAPDGKVQAFLGSSERMGQTTTYRFVCRDREVFFNGDGPRRDFTIPIRRDTELLVNITWGDDVPPPIGGKYAIVNRHSGKVLGVVSADASSGGSVQQMDHGRTAHLQWEVSPLFFRYGDQSYFTIRSAHTGKALTIPEHSYEDGAKVLESGEGDAAWQQWFFEYAGDNCFYIRNRWSTQCLEVAGESKDAGASIQQSTRTGALRQQWRLVPANVQSIDLDAPKTPVGLQASSRPLAVEVRWEAPADGDLAGYTVFRSTTAGGPYETIARGVTGTSFVDNKANERRSYYYVIRAVDHSLNQSAYSAEVTEAPTGGNAPVANYLFDGSVNDGSGNGNHAVAHGGPAFGVGIDGSPAIILDGDDDSVRLPADVASSNDMTISAWIYPEGGVQWQRVFDFGNDETQYLFLTPNSNEGTLRLAARNGGEELRLNAKGLAENRWSHVAVTLSGKTASLYVNGAVVASSDTWTIKPADFKPIFNYIGKSQFVADPTFRGRISQFQIRNHALSADQVAQAAARQPGS